MKFHRIYVELTNICGLSCSFCPTKELPSKSMDLGFFDATIQQAKRYTKDIACHVVGDPMTLSNLKKYLDILEKHQMKALLTTSGYYLKKHTIETLFHPSVKQINISLNSYNKNETDRTLEEYLEPIIHLSQQSIQESRDIFINLRLWNFDEILSEKGFNIEIFDTLSKYFDLILDFDTIENDRPKSIRLGRKVLLHFDTYFEWPSLDNRLYGDGTCQGLNSHIAILASGKVVPCCLDCDGVIELGDLHTQGLDEILENQRTKSIREGFRDGIAVEKLCQHCSYKERFTKEVRNFPKTILLT